MKKLLLSTLLLLLCVVYGYAQQKVYIHISHPKDTVIEKYVWQIDKIVFDEDNEPLTIPSVAEEIDLGLSVKWANFNLGAETESGVGYLLGWGDITGKNHSNNLDYFPIKDPSGHIVADKYDIAKKLWANEEKPYWRLPTQEEIQELIDNCDWVWETIGDVSGYRVSGKKEGTGNIFLPVTGKREKETFSKDEIGCYWSGMINTNNFDEAMALDFSQNETIISGLKRYLGLAIRPVYGKYVIPVSITLKEAANINYTDAVLSATFNGDYDQFDITSYGICYAKDVNDLNPMGTTGNLKIEGKPTSNSFEFTLSSLEEGKTYNYVAYAQVSGSFVYSEILQFTTNTHYPIADMVDLGLSVKWASWNLGASSDQEVGGYYGWGDATGEETRKSNQYYAVGNTSTNIGGNANYDLARAKWGGKWRMPTQEEFEELQSCTWEGTTNYNGSGVSGWIIYGKKGSGYENNHIFIPRAGFLIDGNPKYYGEDADYWTCECRDDNVKAYYVTLYYGFNGNYLSDKCVPIPIRPIYDEASIPSGGGDTPGGDTPGGDTPGGDTPGGDTPGGETPSGDQTMKKGNEVDLGLYVLWADMNVGAEDPYDYGNYYAWGETEPNEKNTYTLSSYKYSIAGATDGDVKESYVDLGNDIKGTEYDVAHVKWGNGWRMPSQTEVNQLLNNCTWEWDDDKGGYKVTGPNGNSIFLPANGYYNGSNVTNSNVGGSYWIGEAHRQSPYYYAHGRALKFTIRGSGNHWFSSDYYRYQGFAVRPVKDK